MIFAMKKDLKKAAMGLRPVTYRVLTTAKYGNMPNTMFESGCLEICEDFYEASRLFVYFLLRLNNW